MSWMVPHVRRDGPLVRAVPHGGKHGGALGTRYQVLEAGAEAGSVAGRVPRQRTKLFSEFPQPNSVTVVARVERRSTTGGGIVGWLMTLCVTPLVRLAICPVSAW
jgi:hypothetical protein